MWATWTAGRKRRNNPCRRGGARSICSRRIITLSSPFCRSFRPRIIKRYNGKARVRVDNAILFHRNRLSLSLSFSHSLSLVHLERSCHSVNSIRNRNAFQQDREFYFLSYLAGFVSFTVCRYIDPDYCWNLIICRDLRWLRLFELESDFENFAAALTIMLLFTKWRSFIFYTSMSTRMLEASNEI